MLACSRAMIQNVGLRRNPECIDGLPAVEWRLLCVQAQVCESFKLADDDFETIVQW